MDEEYVLKLMCLLYAAVTFFGFLVIFTLIK